MADKKKASLTSRIASKCGLFYICAIFLLFGATIIGPGSSAMGAIVFILSCILMPLLGLAGIILGIVALCTLTPEEKQEKIFTSGTTKNQALVGILVPPVMTVLLFLLNLCLHAALK